MTFYASHPFVPFCHCGELFLTYIIPVAKLFCTSELSVPPFSGGHSTTLSFSRWIREKFVSF